MASKTDKNYIAKLKSSASKRYPFIDRYSPLVAVGKGPYYAETWPEGETGGEGELRPANFPIDRTGVMVYRPESFGPSDLAAEFLHVDPFANATRNILQKY